MQALRALVWFKRDLRMHDHAPLVAAQRGGDAAGLFIIEPEWLQSPECDAQHVDFVLRCLDELRAALAARGMPLLVRKSSTQMSRPRSQKCRAMPGCSRSWAKLVPLAL